ncbi:protein of unknown function [Parapedobacter composti]|uniref:DUF4286 domain-containing protein n=1 Tax=Parapedobacter composti TaxID=623281 RepID=A0A1I1HCY2_9SPHI|nr:DUF4286 family protein [Parapedobacter composti]SFC21701.1 protein of unknown function [Parapedobacter composti]
MYLYNVTVIAENGVEAAVKQHIQMQLATQRNDETPARLLEMLDSPHEGTTYCIQLVTQDRPEITAFQKHHLTAIQALTDTYPGKVLFFDSIMKYLND